MTRKRPVRWAISSTGFIAGEFARAIRADYGSTLVAVASRTEERAQKFATAHGAQTLYTSVGELARDSEVDAVYIASPTSAHFADALVCLRAGKAVLAEKPLATTADAVRALVAAARESGVFLMEAVWSRFLPAYERLRAMLDMHTVGTVRAVEASLGFPLPEQDPAGSVSRQYQPALGGGSLLELGVYPIQLVQLALGQPIEVAAAAELTASGVDGTARLFFGCEQGTAAAEVSISSDLDNTALVVGTDGVIVLDTPFHAAQQITVRRRGQPAETYADPIEGHYLGYQLRHVNGCLQAGRIESPLMTLDESVAIAATLSSARDILHH